MIAFIFLLNVVLFMYCAVKAAQKYKKKQMRATLYLTLFFLTLTLISFTSASDALFFGWLYFIPYGYIVSLLITGFCMVLFIFMAIDIFFTREETDYSKPFVIMRYGFAFAEIALCTWGAIDRLLVMGVSTTVPLLLMFMTNFSIYFLLAWKSYNLAKRVDDIDYKKPITYIGHYSIANVIMFLFFIIESFFVGKEGTTIWSFLAAVMISITAILAYIGFVRPVKKV